MEKWGRGNKGERWGEFKYDIFDIRTFVNATMYSQYNKKRKMVKK
jgi:hypothetical protein